jgi:hypothetical protein
MERNLSLPLSEKEWGFQISASGMRELDNYRLSKKRHSINTNNGRSINGFLELVSKVWP